MTILFLTAISTHTLTWSVTIIPLKTIPWQKISTHTLTWSVTFRCLGFWGGLFISTHTLTWSVTCVVQISVAVQKFQLTRSRGAWLKSSCLAHAVIHFNSHAHVERDFYKSSPILTSFCISTHTLTWSVTKFITCSSMVSGISTHTLTWSVTLIIKYFVTPFTFQLTRSRGAWPGDEKTVHELKRFQLTRSRGAWRVNPCIVISTFYFNSHAHVERDNQQRFRYLFGIYFNSHAHVERDENRLSTPFDANISTHTLTWSVTMT